MGLSFASTGKGVSNNNKPDNKGKTLIAVAGNPNVGKSTLFNALTGMKQHTGNWPGKTVGVAFGSIKAGGSEYMLVDIPGTYSLLPHSAEEEVAGDFICFEDYKAAVVVCDATSLERNLNLALQIMEIAPKTVICVNLMDEARRKNIEIDIELLSQLLGVKVVGTVARSKKTLKNFKNVLFKAAESNTATNNFKVKYPKSIEAAIEELSPLIKGKTDALPERWLAVKLIEGNAGILKQINKKCGFDISADGEIAFALKNISERFKDMGITREEISDMIATAFVTQAEEIAKKTVSFSQEYNSLDRKIDRVITSRKFGYPIMLCLLALIFWITISGANYCTYALSFLFSYIETGLNLILNGINASEMLKSFVIEGIFRVPSWVVSVMLPPMAIFFPLFTLLEDSGYLPRVAYSLDKPFKCCGGCGKQALTACMGFGCNAAGVIGCRIIDSKRERMLAILTNNFVPCNGRFPMIIAIISMFFITAGGLTGSILSALALTAVILSGVAMTFVATKFLSKTFFKGVPSSYTLEMPSYRKPKIGSVIVRSVFDRTLFVLARSLAVAVPAGIIIWLMANFNINGESLLIVCADLLDPIGKFIGLDGVILLAFILGFPANEIVIPIALMIYLSGNTLVDMGSLDTMRQILVSNGWTTVTAVCTIVFSLFHWPCSTTVLTIKKETQSLKWAIFSIIYPTVFGAIICMIISFVSEII